MIPTLRTLTRKTKFRIGKDKDLTVQRMLDLGKNLNLVSAYYKLTSINYTEDILEELGIVGDFVIEKPSTNKILYLDFVMEHGLARGRGYASDNLRKMSKPLSKGQLQSKNQGKR